MAIAFESLVNLISFLAVGAFAIFGVFGSFEGLNDWLISRQDLVQTLKETDYLSSFHMMTLLFFSASVAMPHMFYVTFSENNRNNNLSAASWGLPLYFLLLSLPVLPILWARIKADTG